MFRTHDQTQGVDGSLYLPVGWGGRKGLICGLSVQRALELLQGGEMSGPADGESDSLAHCSSRTDMFEHS